MNACLKCHLTDVHKASLQERTTLPWLPQGSASFSSGQISQTPQRHGKQDMGSSGNKSCICRTNYQLAAAASPCFINKVLRSTVQTLVICPAVALAGHFPAYSATHALHHWL